MSPTTVNQVLLTLKIIFREGLRLGDLSFDPTATIQPLGEDRKEKSFLDPPEIKALFDESSIRKYGLKDEPKKGSRRKIPIPSKTQFYLNEIISISPYRDPEDLIFWGPDGRRPIGSKIISNTLYEAFRRIGVTEQERQERNVSFHSWRHFYNSFLRGKVADAKLQRLTGKRTQEMTEHYTSFKIEDFRDVLRIQEDFFESE